MPVQAASGALYLNSSRVTVYNSLFDRNRGEHTLLNSSQTAFRYPLSANGCCSVMFSPEFSAAYVDCQ